MEIKSERTGKFLFVLILVSLLCSFLSFLCSIIHAWNENFYFDNIEWFDTTIALFNTILSLLSIILFLIWIYRVHLDFQQIAGDYPITPGGALRRIIIPFYNIVGLWTVYSKMATFLVKKSDKTMMFGRRLRVLIPFYYFGQMISNVLNRASLRSDQQSISLELWTVGFDVLVSAMYIIMFLIITSGVKATKEHVFVEQGAPEE